MYSQKPFKPWDPIIQVEDPHPQHYRYFRDSFFGIGQDSYTRPPAQDQTQMELLTNVMPISQGILQRRWGYTAFATGLPAAIVRLYKYQNDSNGVKAIVVCAATDTTALDESGAVSQASFLTPVAAALRMAFSRDFGYFTDGASQYKKWNGPSTTPTTWGGVAPATAITFGANNAGNITLLHGRRYYTVYYNSTTGHMTDLSPVSALSSPICNQTQVLNLPGAGADAQFDKIIVLATADGGDTTQLYVLAGPGGTDAALAAASATYEDKTPDAGTGSQPSLILNNVALQTDEFGREIGVASNTPPPTSSTLPIKHQGRLWLAKGRTLFFSKSVDEITTSTGLIAGRYEECWPAVNFFDVSEEAETVKGLFSDGQILYIGTERHIRRLLGDGPLNFNKPEIVFNQTGLMNQDVWRAVFMEGQPSGVMWMTPDNRVILSDFNTYRDVGTPIQDVLNSVNATVAPTTAFAFFASTNAFDLYVLGVPTGSNTTVDTLCIFDLRVQKWLIWKPTDTLSYGLFNITSAGVPQWLVSGAAAKSIFQFQSTATQDNGVSFPVTARTQWLHMGEPTSRKSINSIELLSEDASNLLLTVEGATTGAEFVTPVTVVSSENLFLDPLGRWMGFMSALRSPNRYYRFTFSDTSTVQNLIESFNAEVALFHNI